jgi:hypothetical protein
LYRGHRVAERQWGEQFIATIEEHVTGERAAISFYS